MKEERLQILLADGPTITAIQTSPDKEESGEVFVYAPGAGSNLHDPFGVYLCRQLASDGFTAVRFQFPYMEAGLRRPDSPPVLEDAWRVVVERLRPDGGRLVIGGTSMGGRIASQVVAKGTIVDALALFACPLRPPGRAQVRDDHLPQIGIPTLFCSGTRDSFGTPEELEAAASKVPKSTLRLLEGADHGFGTLKSSGKTKEDVWREATSALIDWLRSAV